MIKKLVDKLQKDGYSIKLNEPMSKHTSFKTGGNAEVYIIAKSIEQIKEVVKLSKENNIPIYIIGNGSNVLVKDEGIEGIVLKIQLEKINIIRKDEDVNVYVEADAGVKLAVLAHKLMQEGIEGFEFASGIPGTIGGAIRMNAGAHGGEMKDIVKSTQYMDENGNIKEMELLNHEFDYRKSIFSNKNYIILKTTFCLKKGDKKEIENKIIEYRNWRKEKQPLEYPNAGSTFKRGKDFITAKLIDECGLKGYKIGGAQVSEKHAGFIINTGNATSKDILELIEYVQKTVYEKCKKNIELEIEIMGNK